MSARGRRFRQVMLIAAAIAAVLCLVGLVLDVDAFLRGWLAAYAFWIGPPLGGLMLLLAHDLTGGRWGRAIRAPLEAAAATLPFLALLFLPVLIGLGRLYPWARAEEAAQLANGFYLNVPFFVVRAIVYFALWIVLAAVAARRASASASTVGAPGLIILGLTATFAAFDWTMSIEPDWASSIYGMLVIGGELIAALAVATLAAVAAGHESDAGERTDLGSLLIAGILVWGYFAFMQFLIIWEENLPKEIVWYLRRIASGWLGVAVAIPLLQGLLPFLALIWWPVKRSRAGLASVCGLLLVAHVLECWWLVLPGSGDHGFTWLAPAATAAMGGAWLALFAWRLETGRLLPLRLTRWGGDMTVRARHG